MNDKGCGQDPDRAKDQEQLNRDHGVYDEIVVGDARKHLRACECRKQRGAVDFGHSTRLADNRSGGLDTCDDTDGTKKYKAAKNNDHTMTPIDAPSQHHQADTCHRDYRHDRGHSAEQRPL